MRTCVMADCEAEATAARGYCSKHYARFLRHGDPSVLKKSMEGRAPVGLTTLERFYHHVKIAESGCWEWQGHLLQGYGRFILNGEFEVSHRAAWMLLRGPIPEGLTLDHLCRNRRCVNPDHLEPVTLQENCRRGNPTFADLNRSKTHCPQGHPYDGPNLIIERSTGRRRCHICKNETNMRYKQRQREALSGRH